MYAIIRAGGKQAKVHEGDVLDIERIKDSDTVSFTPLLIVGDDGKVVSDRAALAKASVTAEVIGDSAGPKIDIFKYKNKTGYRRRQGHRQKYTKIKVTKIKAGGRSTSKKSKDGDSAAKQPSAETASEKKATAKKKTTSSKTTATKEQDAPDTKADKE